MNFNKNKKKIAKEGIVHFWNLPTNNYVILEPQFKNKLMGKFMKIFRTKYNVNKITNKIS